jgi:hypothetical protein
MPLPYGRALICAFTVATSLAGTARSAANPDYACSYSPKANGELIHFEDCAHSDAAGHIHLKHKHLRALGFDRFDLASVSIGDGSHIGDGLYYVRQDGRLARVMMMDNWADPFADGRARSPVDGKIGYIDQNLKLVIPARYDGALPFEHGWAQVCIDCKLASDGEHSWYAGGRWSCIDRHGRAQGPFRPVEGARDICPQ